MFVGRDKGRREYLQFLQQEFKRQGLDNHFFISKNLKWYEKLSSTRKEPNRIIKSERREQMRILFISSSIYPSGSAYSLRLQCFGKLFSALGHYVRIIADNTNCEFSSSYEIRKYEGISYQTISGKPSSAVRLLNTVKSRFVLRKVFAIDKFDLVICGNTYDRFGLINSLCKKKRIPLILEICEWHDTNLFGFHWINPYAYLFDRCIKKNYLKVSGVIGISRLLTDYFNQNGVSAIRIPTILNFDNRLIVESKIPERFRLIHVGFSGSNKEKFKNILAALSKLRNLYDFEYHIYGSTYEEVLLNVDKNNQLLQNLKDHLFIHGRIPQEKITLVYNKASFSIFIRPDKKSSHAGFPTKLAESMYHGVPVIANNTGDIGLYLNNRNGVLLENDSIEVLESTFIRLFKLNTEELTSLRIQALRTAEKYFNYREYQEEVKVFLSSIVKED